MALFVQARATLVVMAFKAVALVAQSVSSIVYPAIETEAEVGLSLPPITIIEAELLWVAAVCLAIEAVAMAVSSMVAAKCPMHLRPLQCPQIEFKVLQKLDRDLSELITIEVQADIASRVFVAKLEAQLGQVELASLDLKLLASLEAGAALVLPVVTEQMMVEAIDRTQADLVLPAITEQVVVRAIDHTGVVVVLTVVIEQTTAEALNRTEAVVVLPVVTGQVVVRAVDRTGAVVVLPIVIKQTAAEAIDRTEAVVVLPVVTEQALVRAVDRTGTAVVLPVVIEQTAAKAIDRTGAGP